MIRYARDGGFLCIFFRFCEELNQDRNAPAVDVGVLLKCKQYAAGPLLAGTFIILLPSLQRVVALP